MIFFSNYSMNGLQEYLMIRKKKLILKYPFDNFRRVCKKVRNKRRIWEKCLTIKAMEKELFFFIGNRMISWNHIILFLLIKYRQLILQHFTPHTSSLPPTSMRITKPQKKKCHRPQIEVKRYLKC